MSRTDSISGQFLNVVVILTSVNFISVQIYSTANMLIRHP